MIFTNIFFCLYNYARPFYVLLCRRNTQILSKTALRGRPWITCSRPLINLSDNIDKLLRLTRNCFKSYKTYLKPRLHLATCCPQHVAFNMLFVAGNKQHVAGNKIVASLLPVCCCIQRDTIMLPRYMQHVTEQHVAECKHGLI